jgi:tRNA pseudouridine55 synthase
MDGIILIDKPAGISSAEVVRRVKALVKPARVGHLGTLDPFATGLLPIMVGEATKLAPFLEGGDKRYEGVIALGVETDTLDPWGEVARTAEVPALDQARLDEIARRFTGTIEQVPPVFSAIKREGVPLYKLARRGGEVAPPAPRRVEIRRLQLALADERSIRFSLDCSPGTYVRSIARDIGVALGTAAHLAELRRTRSSGFSINDAASVEDTLAALRDGAACRAIGMRDALAAIPEVEVDAQCAGRIRNGDSRALDGLAPAGAALFKVVADGRLLAVARAETRITARIERVFGGEDAGGS